MFENLHAVNFNVIGREFDSDERIFFSIDLILSAALWPGVGSTS
jgi:hypothetical protein